MCEENFKEWIQRLKECSEENFVELFETEQKAITNVLKKEYPVYSLEIPGFVSDAFHELWKVRKKIELGE